MKILIANPYFPPYAPGGAEHSLAQMCERFSEVGWTVRIVTNCYDGNPRRDVQSGYEVEWIQCPVRLLPGQQIDASIYTSSGRYDDNLSTALVKAAVEMGPETLLLANNSQSYLGTIRAARSTNLPAVGIVRDTQVICEAGACIDNKPANIANPCLGPLGLARCILHFQRKRGVTGYRPIAGIMAKGFLLGMRRELLRKEGLFKFDKVITISDALRYMILKIPALRLERVRTIRNFHTNIPESSAEEVDQFLLSIGLERGKYFLIAGRKTIGKGADIAVEATHKLTETRADVNSLFLGREQLWMNTKTNVVDHESVSQSLLLGILKASSALVIPGRWQEGLHRTMIDALFLGIPVICTESGAPSVDGVIDGRTGYVIPCEDSAALASAMARVLDWTIENREACRIASIERFRSNFGTDQLLSQWEEVFTDLAKR